MRISPNPAHLQEISDSIRYRWFFVVLCRILREEYSAQHKNLNKKVVCKAFNNHVHSKQQTKQTKIKQIKQGTEVFWQARVSKCAHRILLTC